MDSNWSWARLLLYYNRLQVVPFCGGVGGSPAKQECRVACAKANCGVVFYPSDLSLPGASSLDSLEAFTTDLIPYPRSPQLC